MNLHSLTRPARDPFHARAAYTPGNTLSDGSLDPLVTLARQRVAMRSTYCLANHAAPSDYATTLDALGLTRCAYRFRNRVRLARKVRLT